MQQGDKVPKKKNSEGKSASNSSPMLIAHPIPRGSTVVATPALSPPQWPTGTNITIHVDSQYELFNRACATPGIGSAQTQDLEGINIGSLKFILEKLQLII